MIDGKALWAEVQENARKARECQRHRFEHETVTIGMKINCLNCGGYLRLTDIGYYIAGYEAAGGKAADIWPSYARPAVSCKGTGAMRSEAEPVQTPSKGQET